MYILQQIVEIHERSSNTIDGSIISGERGANVVD